jgi:hypothetical protein
MEDWHFNFASDPNDESVELIDFDGSDGFFQGIISFMNKRAKKRLLEAIKKDKLERAKPGQDRTPTSPKDPKQQTGFLPRPDKKRG